MQYLSTTTSKPSTSQRTAQSNRQQLSTNTLYNSFTNSNCQYPSSKHSTKTLKHLKHHSSRTLNNKPFDNFQHFSAVTGQQFLKSSPVPIPQIFAIKCSKIASNDIKVSKYILLSKYHGIVAKTNQISLVATT